MQYSNAQGFRRWVYAYETDYKQISLKSIGYIYFNNGLIFQWAQRNLNTSAYNNSFSSWTYPIAFPENGYAGDHVFPWGVWGTNTEEPFQTRIPVFIFPHAHISFTKMDFDFTLFQVNSSGVTSLSATGLNTKIYVIGF